MSLQIGTLGSPSLAHAYMATDQNHKSFQTLSASLLRMFPFACVTVHEPACECRYVKFRAGVQENSKRNESTEKPGAPRSHFMSLQTGTLDSRSLAYF